MASESSQQFLQRAYALSNADEARTLYNEWAASYDEDLKSQAYVSPQLAVDAIKANLPTTAVSPRDIRILDAGCGTGLVGRHLASSLPPPDYKLAIDGIDLTGGMLEVARKTRVYRILEEADLSQAIAKEDDSYDVVVCVGTLTKGHVGPRVLEEFARVTVSDGIIVVTIHESIWKSGGYEGVVEDLERRQLIKLISIEKFGFLEGQSEGGLMVVLKLA